MTEETRARKKGVDKRSRVPFGGFRAKLQLSDADNEEFKRRNRVVRWFNDQDGRIEAALAGGWDFVDPKYARSVGAMGLHEENTDLNSKVSKVVSRGEPIIRAYLMEIDKQWFDEDQQAKEDHNRLVDSALNPTDQGGQSIESGYTPR